MSTQTKAVSVRQEQINTIESSLFNHKNAFVDIVPKDMSVDRLLRSIVVSVSKTPALRECTPGSLFLCAIQAAQWGLEPDTALQHCHMVPLRIKGVMTAQLWPNYRGLIKLAMNTGDIASIEARVVYEKDVFSFGYGSAPFVEHVPYLGDDPGKIKCVYSVIQPQGTKGQPLIEVMPMREINAIRNKAKTSKIWNEHPAEMARKTVTKKNLKYVPLSAIRADRLGSALAADNALSGGASYAPQGLDEAKRLMGDAIMEDLPTGGDANEAETAGNASLKASVKKKVSTPSESEPDQQEPPPAADDDLAGQAEPPKPNAGGSFTIPADAGEMGADGAIQQGLRELDGTNKAQLKNLLEQQITAQGVETYQSLAGILHHRGLISVSVLSKMTRNDLSVVVAILGLQA